MFEGDAKQLEKNIEYFMRYEQRKNRPLPIHHPSPIIHHPSPIIHHPSVKQVGSDAWDPGDLIRWLANGDG